VRFACGLLAIVLALGACKKAEPPPYQGMGRAIYRGPAREVIVAPDGSAIGWIADPVQARERGTNAPDHVYVGRATYFTGSGEPIVLGENVATTTKVGTFFFSPTGEHVGALTEWSFERGEGTLVVGSTRGKGVRRVAPKVSFFAFSRDGKWLGYVSDGRLLVEPADGGQPVELTTQVATFEFSPDAQQVLARKRSIVGGQLMLVRRDGQDPARPIAARVNEYKWSPDGTLIAYTMRSDENGSELFVLDMNGVARRVGKGVPSFAFSPRGRHLAFIGDTSPKKQFGDLYLLVDGADEAVKLGETVTEFAFSPDERRIAWLDGYRAEDRGGTLKWRSVGGEESHELAKNVPSFVFSPDGNCIAFIQRVLQPVFSIDLFLARLSGPKPEVFSIAKGVFGYSFSRDSRKLFLRTECVRSGRVCELYSVEVADPANTVTKVAGRIHTYELDPVDGSVVMLTYARVDSDNLDLGVAPSDGSAGAILLDRMVVPGTKLLGGAVPRIAYAVNEPGRAGVYVADIPAFEAATAAP